MYTEIAVNYLSNFAKKNINDILTCFSESITLRDWDFEASGKEKVAKFLSELFDKVDTISVDVYKTYEVDRTVLIEMEILIDDTSLLVTDVIEFNNNHQIKSIRAYLG